MNTFRLPSVLCLTPLLLSLACVDGTGAETGADVTGTGADDGADGSSGRTDGGEGSEGTDGSGSSDGGSESGDASDGSDGSGSSSEDGGTGTEAMTGPRVVFRRSDGGTPGLFSAAMDLTDVVKISPTLTRIVAVYPSPDGTQLAYTVIEDGETTVALQLGTAKAADGQTVSTGTAGVTEVKWSPDGAYVAYATDEPALHVVGADGTGDSRIETYAGNQANWDWSPSGSHLSILTDLDDDRQLELLLHDARTGTTVDLRDTHPNVMAKTQFSGFDWTPDGSKVAYATGEPDTGGMGLSRGTKFKVHIANPDGTGVVDVVGEMDSARGTQGSFDWSPDGTKLRFISSPSGFDGGGGMYEPPRLWVIDADGSGKVEIGGDERVSPVGQIQWSPDSTMLAYEAGELGGMTVNGRAWVGMADGSGSTDLGAAHRGVALWSPDGSRLAFRRDDGTGAFDLWTVDADGSDAAIASRARVAGGTVGETFRWVGDQVLYEADAETVDLAQLYLSGNDAAISTASGELGLVGYVVGEGAPWEAVVHTYEDKVSLAGTLCVNSIAGGTVGNATCVGYDDWVRDGNFAVVE